MKKWIFASSLLSIMLIAGCSEVDPKQEVQADDKEKTEEVEKKEEPKKEEGPTEYARDRDRDKLTEVALTYDDLVMFSSGIIHDIEYKGEGIVHVVVDEVTWARTSESGKESFVLMFEQEVEQPLLDAGIRNEDEAIHTHYYSKQVGDKLASEKMLGGFDIKR